jgi:hypothetical protein
MPQVSDEPWSQDTFWLVGDADTGRVSTSGRAATRSPWLRPIPPPTPTTRSAASWSKSLTPSAPPEVAPVGMVRIAHPASAQGAQHLSPRAVRTRAST